jgi:hypothetical protein
MATPGRKRGGSSPSKKRSVLKKILTSFAVFVLVAIGLMGWSVRSLFVEPDMTNLPDHRHGQLVG